MCQLPRCPTTVYGRRRSCGAVFQTAVVLFRAGRNVGNVEAVPTINRYIFSEVASRTLHMVDPSRPKVPMQVHAAANVSAFAVDSRNG